MDVEFIGDKRNVNRTFCMTRNTGKQTSYWPKGKVSSLCARTDYLWDFSDAEQAPRLSLLRSWVQFSLPTHDTHVKNVSPLKAVGFLQVLRSAFHPQGMLTGGVGISP